MHTTTIHIKTKVAKILKCSKDFKIWHMSLQQRLLSEHDFWNFHPISSFNCGRKRIKKNNFEYSIKHQVENVVREHRSWPSTNCMNIYSKPAIQQQIKTQILTNIKTQDGNNV